MVRQWPCSGAAASLDRVCQSAVQAYGQPAPLAVPVGSSDPPLGGSTAVAARPPGMLTMFHFPRAGHEGESTTRANGREVEQRAAWAKRTSCWLHLPGQTHGWAAGRGPSPPGLTPQLLTGQGPSLSLSALFTTHRATAHPLHIHLSLSLQPVPLGSQPSFLPQPSPPHHLHFRHSFSSEWVWIQS